ncbi:MAG: CRTAC1 family protein [Planctomycetota bacterium]
MRARRVGTLTLASLVFALVACGEETPLPRDVARWAAAGSTRLRFDDASAASGISAVNHTGRAGTKEFLIEAMGPGPAWLDADGDGWLDLFLPDGEGLGAYELVEVPEPGTRRARPLLRRRDDADSPGGDTLWRNRGDGTFEDVTRAAGIAGRGWSFGALAFDMEGDGDTDVLVARFGKNLLWRNLGDGTFEEVGEALGVAGPVWAWTTCAAAGDLDGDGRLDLYLAQYADPAAEVAKRRDDPNQADLLPPGAAPDRIGGRACRWQGLTTYCGPIGLDAQHDVVLRQREDGTFEDVTAAWGFVPPAAQYGFQVLIVDLSEDGLLDVFVANDSVENFLWVQSRAPDGTPRFRDDATVRGVKLGTNDSPQASMGAAVADADQDGLLDLAATNFSRDYNNIWKARRVKHTGMVFFRDRGLALIGAATYMDLSWGVGWQDFDNDADLDLFIANGHVYREVDDAPGLGSYAQPNTLFECMDVADLGYREVGAKAMRHPGGGVEPAALDAGPGLEIEASSRGAAFGDYDDDGRVDVFVGNMNERPSLLHNVSRDGGTWVKLVLQQPGPNREAVGARLRVASGGRTQTFPVLRGSSFLGTDDPRVHVGLGAAATCDVQVDWPAPQPTTVRYAGLEAGAMHRLRRDGSHEEVALGASRDR